jgi:DNA-binding transcriptional regulator GbsR (MarR family)
VKHVEIRNTERVNGAYEGGVRDFVERLALSLAEYGFPRMPARVMVGLMAAEEDSLTAAELGERLEVSPAAISGAVRYLIRIGMLERVPAAGSRRDRYRLPVDPWYEVASQERGYLGRLAQLTDDGTRALAESPAAAERVARMRDFFLFMQGEMDGLLARWRERRP